MIYSEYMMIIWVFVLRAQLQARPGSSTFTKHTPKQTPHFCLSTLYIYIYTHCEVDVDHIWHHFTFALCEGPLE